jgi:TnpA family transposase
MNRTKRRAAMRAAKKENRMANKLGPIETPFRINYGHDEERVILQFSVVVGQVVRFTPGEVDSLIEGLQKSKAMLLAHKAKAAN